MKIIKSSKIFCETIIVLTSEFESIVPKDRDFEEFMDDGCHLPILLDETPIGYIREIVHGNTDEYIEIEVSIFVNYRMKYFDCNEFEFVKNYGLFDSVVVK